ncbi:hypothetical protein BBD42_16315 [Paenibacillus sp. BIHB 4019]|uniref:Uncharacterized protein n=1 Tax=Paenibacillus sp. BIHB 4019 TaxID=1870819 RepID=A0A1B2DJG2_9BACL|nr:hypothetical protein [Paenibacillus sp. BIHB 4019]ANY67862.1 hypothetical protein BBD42_16315 [Paenibacillus sp. BIHB 4019]
MNIYGHIKHATEELEPVFSEKNKIDNDAIITAIRSSWIYIHKYIKNINPTWTNPFNNRLNCIKALEIMITKDMLTDTSRAYERLKNERIVKSYMTIYMGLMQSLLVFNKPFEESCDRCQGALYYYTNLTENILIKECNTCSAWYDSHTGENLQGNRASILRPTTKFELIYAKLYNP